MYSKHKNDKIETNHYMPFIVIMPVNFYYNIFSYLIGTLDVSTNKKASFFNFIIFINGLHYHFCGSRKPIRYYFDMFKVVKFILNCQ